MDFTFKYGFLWYKIIHIYSEYGDYYDTGNR